MGDQPQNTEVLLHNVAQILEMIRSRETNALLFFAGLVAVNSAVAGWLMHNDRWQQRRLPLLFGSMIVANLIVAAGFIATGYEYYLWREQLASLQQRIHGLELPLAFFHMGMVAVYVLTALIFALLWTWAAKQKPAPAAPTGG